MIEICHHNEIKIEQYHMRIEQPKWDIEIKIDTFVALSTEVRIVSPPPRHLAVTTDLYNIRHTFLGYMRGKMK
jgi:hypothetical protein